MLARLPANLPKFKHSESSLPPTSTAIMGKKRKAHGQPFGEPNAKSIRDESKLVVHSYQDVADSEDEFDLERDKILLDETPADRARRRLRDQGG